MTYVPRKPIFMHAVKYTNILTPELQQLGFMPIPQNIMFQCQCGRPQNEHIFINGKGAVCPYNYIMYDGSEITGVMTIDNFESMYKPIEYEDANFSEVTAEEKPSEGETV